MMNFIYKINTYLNQKSLLPFHLIGLFLVVNYLFSGFSCRLDVSESGRFQLTKSSKTILTSLTDTLYIDAYYSTEIPPEYQSRIQLAKEMLKEIAAVESEKVQLRFFDPDNSEKEKNQALEAGIEPQTLQKVEMGAAQVKQAFMGITLRLGKEIEVIPVVFFAEEVESQILSTLKKMIRREKNASSGVAILVEPGSMDAPMPGTRSGKDSFGVFMHQIFAPEYGPAFPFSLQEDPLPSDIQVLIAVGLPELTTMARYNLDQFLLKGGKLIILPRSMNFTLDDQNSQSGLSMGQKGFAQTEQGLDEYNEFFSHYGFRVKANMVLESDLSMPMGPVVQMEQGLMGRYHYPLWILASKDSETVSSKSPFTKDLEVLLLPWTSSLEVNQESQPDVLIEPIIQSSVNASTKEDYLFIGEKEVFQMETTPEGKKLPLGLHLKGKFISYFKDRDLPKGASKSSYLEESISDSESEILVIGSPYLISDLLVLREFREIYQIANAPFFLNAIDILQGDEDLVAARSKKPAFEALNNFSKSEELFYSIVNIVLLPLAIAFYAFIRMRRRAKGNWKSQ